MVVGSDTGEIKIGGSVRLEFVKKFITAAHDIETASEGPVQSQPAQIADPMGNSVYEAPANSALADAPDAPCASRHDGLFDFARDICVGKIIGFALERQRNAPGHWVLAEQTADFRVVRWPGDVKLDPV